MRCNRCSSRGYIWFNENRYGPCPECLGATINSCCEGAEPKIATYKYIEAPAGLKKRTLPDDPPPPAEVIITELTFVDLVRRR